MQKKWQKLWKRVVLTVAIVAGVLVLPFAVQAKKEQQTVDVLFTHDLHSHLDLFQAEVDGKVGEYGGVARIQTLIKEQKAKNPDTLVVDGGDFSMGTLFQTIYGQQAPELRILGLMGYDATTLGNHEYDYRTDGLVQMLRSAIDSDEQLPAIVLCNVDWKNLNAKQKELQKAFREANIKDYIIVKKGNVKIGITGVFGIDALSCAPTCDLKFKDPVKAVQKTVQQMKDKEKPDLIICLSHSGTWADSDKSEDEILAKSVPELDLIISGHTHSRMSEPIVHGNTAIVSCGEYGETLGSLHFEQKSNGRWKVSDFRCIPVTKSIQSDTEIEQIVSNYRQRVNLDFLSRYNYISNQIIAKNPYHFSSVLEVNEVHKEHTLGNIIADSYVYAATKVLGDQGDPVDMAVVPSGTIRDTYHPGNLTVSDIFTSYSLGIGPDQVPGYPLISVYLTGAELRTAVEIDASLSDMMTSARLYWSGLNFSFGPKRILLNKVTDVYQVKDEKQIELKDDKLYHVVVDLYSAQMLSAVTDLSKGVLSLVPKDQNGKPIQDFEKQIIYDGDKELKAWVSIIEYMKSFPKDEENVSVIPQKYEHPEQRKVVSDSSFIQSLFHPNRYSGMIMGVVAGVFVLLAGIVTGIVLVIKRIRRKKRLRKEDKGEQNVM